MSAKKQAGQLRAILARNFKKSRVKEAMAQTLTKNGQVASGNLVGKILSMSAALAFRVSYRINKEFDVIYDVRVSYDIDRAIGVPYASKVDTVLGREKSGMSPSSTAIEQWIKQKLSNGTWKGSNMYIMKKGGKTYSYPLSNFKYRSKLAYIIARGIKERGYLKNRSPFLTEGKLRQELAFLDSKNEFEALWGEELARVLGNKIQSLF